MGLNTPSRPAYFAPNGAQYGRLARLCSRFAASIRRAGRAMFSLPSAGPSIRALIFCEMISKICAQAKKDNFRPLRFASDSAEKKIAIFHRKPCRALNQSVNIVFKPKNIAANRIYSNNNAFLSFNKNARSQSPGNSFGLIQIYHYLISNPARSRSIRFQLKDCFFCRATKPPEAAAFDFN